MNQDQNLQEIIVACCSGNCPKVFLDKGATVEKEVIITDDFNNEVRMSREQFKIMVEKARNIQF